MAVETYQRRITRRRRPLRQVSYRIPPDMHQAIGDRAEDAGIAMNDMAIELLGFALAHYPAATDPSPTRQLAASP